MRPGRWLIPQLQCGLGRHWQIRQHDQHPSPERLGLIGKSLVGIQHRFDTAIQVPVKLVTQGVEQIPSDVLHVVAIAHELQ